MRLIPPRPDADISFVNRTGPIMYQEQIQENPLTSNEGSDICPAQIFHLIENRGAYASNGSARDARDAGY
jgi:hypothetical protein